MKLTFLRCTLLSLTLSIAAFANVANAGLIILDTSNVIGSTSPYGNQFLAEYILDNQSGVITETNQSANDVDGGYWLNPNNGTADAWITIDLGSGYAIDFIELFNTHNGRYFDRGTGDFRILAGNSVSQGNLTGNISTLIDSTLLAEARSRTDPLTGQSFSVTNSNIFRYIQFRADSVAVGGRACCGANVYGLNEIKITAVPEPTILLIFGISLVVLASRRYRKS